LGVDDGLGVEDDGCPWKGSGCRILRRHELVPDSAPSIWLVSTYLLSVLCGVCFLCMSSKEFLAIFGFAGSTYLIRLISITTLYSRDEVV
jgi:hypothetical protein